MAIPDTTDVFNDIIQTITAIAYASPLHHKLIHPLSPAILTILLKGLETQWAPRLAARQLIVVHIQLHPTQLGHGNNKPRIPQNWCPGFGGLICAEASTPTGLNQAIEPQ